MERGQVTALEVRGRLEGMADSAYREFHGSLVPGVNHILGVRLPKLRVLAKEFSGRDWEEWFFRGEDYFYEETMLRGLTAAYAKMDCAKRFACIREFLPDINNWAVCDSFCNTLKDVRNYPVEYWDFLESFFSSGEEYEARFAAVMLLTHFVKREYLEESLKRLESIRQEGYYAKMAVAWAVSAYFAAFPKEVLAYLQDGCCLDKFTYKKSLQKIMESYRVDEGTKNIIREMRQRG